MLSELHLTGAFNKIPGSEFRMSGIRIYEIRMSIVMVQVWDQNIVAAASFCVEFLCLESEVAIWFSLFWHLGPDRTDCFVLLWCLGHLKADIWFWIESTWCTFMIALCDLLRQFFPGHLRSNMTPQLDLHVHKGLCWYWSEGMALQMIGVDFWNC